MDNNNSGVNTILLVIIIALVVGLGVWYVRGGLSAPREDNDMDIQVEIPTGQDNGQNNQPQEGQ